MKAAYGKFPILRGRQAEISGYGFSRGVTQKSLDTPLCCMTVLVWENNRYLLITLDTVAVSVEFTKEIKDALAFLGFKNQQIAIIATHTHSGPGISCFPDDFNIGKSSIRNRELADEIRNQIVHYTVKLCQMIEPVKLFAATVSIKGCYGNRNRQDGDACKKIYLLRLDKIDGCGTLVYLVNMSCHSTILKADTMEFSADLAGAVRRNVEEMFQAPCLLTIGAAGDVSSRFYVKEHDYQAVINTGNQIGKQIKQAVFVPVTISGIKIMTVPLNYYYEPSKDMELTKRIVELAGTDMNFMVSTLKKRKEHGYYHIKTEAVIVKTEEFTIVFFPGELVTALGNRIRESAKGNILLCCYANDYWQYFVAEDEYGKYFETANSICPKGLADQFVEMIINKLRI